MLLLNGNDSNSYHGGIFINLFLLSYDIFHFFMFICMGNNIQQCATMFNNLTHRNARRQATHLQIWKTKWKIQNRMVRANNYAVDFLCFSCLLLWMLFGFDALSRVGNTADFSHSSFVCRIFSCYIQQMSLCNTSTRAMGFCQACICFFLCLDCIMIPEFSHRTDGTEDGRCLF